MSIQSEIERISQAKTDIHSAIESKGVTVPDDTLISEMAPYIQQIREAGTVVTSVSNIEPDESGNAQLKNLKIYCGEQDITYNGEAEQTLTINPATVGAATAAQGALADSAVQPSDLNVYVFKYTDISPADTYEKYVSQGKSVIITHGDESYLLSSISAPYFYGVSFRNAEDSFSFEISVIYGNYDGSAGWTFYTPHNNVFYSLPPIDSSDTGKIVTVQSGGLDFVELQESPPVNHASSNTDYGVGSDTYYGHVN